MINKDFLQLFHILLDSNICDNFNKTYSELSGVSAILDYSGCAFYVKSGLAHFLN